jgi:hypothetical protein
MTLIPVPPLLPYYPDLVLTGLAAAWLSEGSVNLDLALQRSLNLEKSA